jgi:hypothetical protein
MQNFAVNAILLALKKLRAHGGHGTTQYIVGNGFQAAAVDEWKEGVEALPVYVEVMGDGILRRRR